MSYNMNVIFIKVWFYFKIYLSLYQGILYIFSELDFEKNEVSSNIFSYKQRTIF